MVRENLLSEVKKPVNFRLCNVSSYTAELLEIRADDPKLHVLFVPGNPGVITFYKELVEALYENLGGNASITAVGHAAQTKKNLENGRLFSLQEQIDHKMDFVSQELQNTEVPIVLVGHSIGSYITVEMLKRSSEKVIYCIGLYPFLALNQQSVKQSIIGKISASSIASAALSFTISSLGILPSTALRFLVSQSLGRSWSATAVEATCTHLSQYHVMRNILFMAETEFKKLSETPDWEFMRKNQGKLAFLYGIDDHWGPLQMFEEISKQAPGIDLSIEREGHTHSFCCSEAGSIWVAYYVASLIKNKTSSLSQ
ncbi:Lipid droplet-associated hydrolase [Melia azedarach]|uniref:Lipid droplet-associated hydrolase n=1 Tax=Melia azedarach TaxID=155640 RepID=A0ACC1X207_MELAZ|nr:Lipid droplet-associated hydrolase [Melia azedarach]